MSTRPLAELTGFRTRKGLVLLYEPSPLDKWINKKIQKEAGGTFTDMESRGTLTKQEASQYRAYGRRHTARNEDARLADKLFHIVDKYLPLQADETRAYIARFPAQAKTLLPKARKIRNKLRREAGPQATTHQTAPQGGNSSRRTACEDPGPQQVPAEEEHQQGEACENSKQGDQSVP